MGNEENVGQAVASTMAEIEKSLREKFGDDFLEGLHQITKQRDEFRTVLTHAVESGLSGAAMAELLDSHAWLYKYLCSDENLERKLQFMATVERALKQCAGFLPHQWRLAVAAAERS